MYSVQILLTPLLPLFFGYVIYRLYLEKKFSLSASKKIWAGLALFFLLLCLNSWNGIQAIESFRRLRADQVLSVNFYDEARDYGLCRPEGNQLPANCLEQSVTDPRLIAKLVPTFQSSSAYAPNHEGAREKYLLSIHLKSGQVLWAILGKGNRNTDQLAWLEFNSGIRDGMHYGVYLNEPLFHVLMTELKLKKWQKK